MVIASKLSCACPELRGVWFCLPSSSVAAAYIHPPSTRPMLLSRTHEQDLISMPGSATLRLAVGHPKQRGQREGKLRHGAACSRGLGKLASEPVVVRLVMILTMINIIT